MKKTAIILFFLLLLSLCTGCGAERTNADIGDGEDLTAAGTNIKEENTISDTETTPETETVSEIETEPATEENANGIGQSDGVVLQGEYMVSDGEYIYCCPTENFSNIGMEYETYFGEDLLAVYQEEEAANQLIRYSITDLSDREVLYNQYCRWLSIDDGRLYFTDDKQNMVLSMKLDGSDFQTEYTCAGEYSSLGSVCHKDGKLYYVEDYRLYCLNNSQPELLFDSENYREKCEEGIYERNDVDWDWLTDFRITSDGIYLVITGFDSRTKTMGRLLYLPNGETEIEFVDESGQYICQNGDSIYYHHRDATIEDGYFRTTKYGDPVYQLASVSHGTEYTVFGRELDSRTLFLCGNTLYYDSNESDLSPWIEGFEAIEDQDERYIMAYSLDTGAETLISADIHPMYLTGVAGNIIWCEYIKDNTWISLADFPYVAATVMSAERTNVWDTEKYGPETSYLHLAADSEETTAFRLIRTDDAGTEEFFVILQPGQTCVEEFPCGTYILKIAQGSEWISEEEAFGLTGTYMVSEPYHFYANQEYSIDISYTAGDFNSDSASGFTN